VFFDQFKEPLPAQSAASCRFRPVVLELGEGLIQEPLFKISFGTEIIVRAGIVYFLPQIDLRGKMLLLDQTSICAQDNTPLDLILKLSNVTGPSVVH
jgi:hypothetical protein